MYSKTKCQGSPFITHRFELAGPPSTTIYIVSESIGYFGGTYCVLRSHGGTEELASAVTRVGWELCSLGMLFCSI